MVEPSQKKRKKKQSNDQQSFAEGSAEGRETDITDPVGQDGSTDWPTPNLALEDDPEGASPKVPLQLKKKSKKTSERGAISRQAPSAAASNVARAPTSSIPRDIGWRRFGSEKDFKG